LLFLSLFSLLHPILKARILLIIFS
jgi:hypothetical protein